MAIDNVGSVEYDSRITTDKLKRDAAEVERIAKKAGDDIGDHSDRGSNRAGEAFSRFGRVAAVALAATGAAVVAFGVSSAKAFIESENAVAQTEAVLKSTGQVAGVTSKMVTDLANSFQRQTRYSDETIRSAENMLLTFTNISKKTFPDATQAVLDMSTAMGTDLQSTAIQVGKALQDPVLGATALQRVGVRLTESQKELIKSLVASGDAAGAQAVILKELQTEFGGSAKAAGETFAGRLDILKNQLGEVQEGIGQLILVGLAPLVSGMLQWYDSVGGVEGIMSSLKATIDGIMPQLVQWWSNITNVANAIGNYLGPKLQELWTTISTQLAPALERLWKEVILPLIPVVGTALVVAIGLAIDTINGIIGATSNLIQFWLDLVEKAKWVAGGIQSIYDKFANADGPFQTFRNAADKALGPIDELIGGIIQGVETLNSKLGQASSAADRIKGLKLPGVGGAVLRALPGFAGGTNFAPGGPAIVGENGPEAVYLPRGSQVIPNHDLEGSSNSTINVTLNMSGIMARSTADLREVGKDILRAINQELTAKGQPAIGDIR